MDILDKIQKIQAMTPKPGDIIIINVSKECTIESMEQLAGLVRESINDIGYSREQCPIIVTKEDIKIDIIRKEE